MDCRSHTIFEDRHVVDCAMHFGEEFLSNVQKISYCCENVAIQENAKWNKLEK